MVWTQPMTFTANSVLTAAQLNVHLRDNLMASEAGIAQEDQDYFISDGYQRLARRQAAHQFIATQEICTSTDYTDLPTVGPSVTVKTTNRAWIIMTTFMEHTVSNNRSFMSFAITRPEGVENPEGVLVQSGQTASDGEELSEGEGGREAHDNWALTHDGVLADRGVRRSYVDFISADLTPGFNTFTCKYRVSTANTGCRFQNRSIIVIPM